MNFEATFQQNLNFLTFEIHKIILKSPYSDAKTLIVAYSKNVKSRTKQLLRKGYPHIFGKNTKMFTTKKNTKKHTFRLNLTKPSLWSTYNMVLSE